jgi:hypothetical protein
LINKKSWLFHCASIAARVFCAAAGVDFYQISYNASKSNSSLNQEFIGDSEPYLTPILISMIPLGAILDIAVWWRPHLARFICCFEGIYLAILMVCPLDFGALNRVACLSYIFTEYVLFGNFDG